MRLGKGKHGEVTDNFDGTVTKSTNELTEILIANKFKGFNFKYIANYIDVNNIEGRMIKERINQDPHLPNNIRELLDLWDKSLSNTNYLLDFINNYLISDIQIKFDCMRAIITFHRYLYVGNKKVLPLLLELVDLVQELKNNNLYSVDWNMDNFGIKNNHLALFELGGAKTKVCI